LGDNTLFPGSQAEETRKGFDTFGDHLLTINDDKAGDGILIVRSLNGSRAERHDMHHKRRRSIFIRDNE
jgi:hypothetical protein